MGAAARMSEFIFHNLEDKVTFSKVKLKRSQGFMLGDTPVFYFGLIFAPLNLQLLFELKPNLSFDKNLGNLSSKRDDIPILAGPHKPQRNASKEVPPFLRWRGRM